jgi:hypothetical protein
MTDASASASNNITETEANATCWRLIVNENTLGPNYVQIIKQNFETAKQFIQMCIADLQVPNFNKKKSDFQVHMEES